MSKSSPESTSKKSANQESPIEIAYRSLEQSIQFIDIDQPSDGGNVVVAPNSPGACEGSTNVNGTVSPIGNADLIGIVVKMNGGNTVTLGPPQASWNTNIGGVQCECLPGQTGDNVVSAEVEWDLAGTRITESTTSNFTAKCLGPTIPPLEAVKESQQSSGCCDMQSTPIDEGEGLEPVEIDGQWLCYKDLVTSDPFCPGKTLMLGGKPLAAQSIAAAATEVNWYFKGDSRRPITHPTGINEDVARGVRFCHLIFGREAYRFLNAPKCSICIYQSGNARYPEEVATGLRATDKNSPDIIGLAWDQPIRVRVNDCRDNPLPNSGYFTLWVRVVS